MARTRGASNVIHADDGELLDKEGKPIPVTAHGTATWTGVAQQPNPDVVPQAPDSDPSAAEHIVSCYRCDERTVQRNMDARDLFMLLGLILGQPLSMDLSEEQFRGLHPDLRQHFRRVA